MDKTNNRKGQMELALEAANNTAVDEHIYIDMALRDEATDLAHQRFKNPSEGHIDCVYLRLLKNQEWGLGYARAVTVHQNYGDPMADHFKSSFDLPDGVAERLLKEASDEAIAANPSDKPLAGVKLDILIRKTRKYWDSVD